MKLYRITIANFRSFKGEETFSFPAAPGLYFMQGINLAEPRLGGNAAGKTTIWEALTWLLFGKTGKGLKAGDVCNWDFDRGTRVELGFEMEDGAVSLQVMKRTWKPNAWTLQDLFGNVTDLTKDEANEVLAALRLEFTPFLNCILMAQGQPMFLDQKHDVKAALFSDVMGLDRWLDYSAKASKRASAQDSISRGYERDLAGFKSTLAQIQGQDLTKTMKHWEQERTSRLAALEDRYELALGKRKQVKAKIPAATALCDEKALDVVDATGWLTQTKERLEHRKEDEDGAHHLFAQAKANYAAMQDSREELASGECPTCGQKVPHDHLPSPAKLKALLKLYDEAESTWQRAVMYRREMEDTLEDFENQKADVQANLREADESLRRLQRDLQMMERELDAMEEQAEAIVKEKNPYAELHSLQREAGEDADRAITRTQRLLDDSNSRYSMFSFWVRGFKDLRLQLIAEALNELEIEVNSCVASLGLVDWELNFQVDRETKGGNIQRGFNVFVKSPHNENPVPWEAWSGGEAQRLRIAATMGLANLIRSRTGTELELEVWDEPSTGLSKQGINDLLESLAARALHEGRIIFAVDHTAHAFGNFAGVCTITKTTEGSKITWSY